jgi:hypothetical protein
MKRFFVLMLASALATSSLLAGPPATVVSNPNPLPLALDDAIQFRKTNIYLHDPKVEKQTLNEMINFERQRMNYGAILAADRLARYGYYYTFYWRTKRPANLTLRFEYRQEKLGAHVLAQELSYNDVKGTVHSEFRVIGDDYADEGKVTAWRALLIENGKIVALNQSFLWD